MRYFLTSKLAQTDSTHSRSMEAGAKITRPSDGHGGLGEGQAVEHPSGHSNGQTNNNDHSTGDDISEDGLFVDQDEDIKSESEDEDEDASGPGPQTHDKDDYNADDENHLVPSVEDDDENESGPGANEDSHDSEAEHDSDPGDEDDDECMIVDENDVPDDAKAKFANFKFGGFSHAADDGISLGPVQIKVEEGGDDVFAFSSDSGDGDSDFWMDENDILSDGEGPRKRRRSGVKPRDNPNGKSARADSQLQHLQELSAMPTADELAELYKQRDELNLLSARGPLKLPQSVALGQLRGRIAAIENMATQQSLGEGHSSDSKLLGNTTVTTGHNQNRPAAPPTKKVRRAAKTAKEYWARAYREKGLGIRNVDGNLNKRKRMPIKPAKGKNGKDSDTNESRLMRMLQNSNPIVARAAQGAIAMPGPIQATKQKDQLRKMKDLFFKITGNTRSHSKPEDEKRLEAAVKSFGYKKVRASDGRWELRTGMASTLYSHQVVGSSWMLGQEFSPDGPYGGILADQMGLGKTVQVIAAMSANRPSPEDIRAGRHQTLIVAPANVIAQWGREIRKHCLPSFIKVVHHYKASAKVGPDLWKKADVM